MLIRVLGRWALAVALFLCTLPEEAVAARPDSTALIGTWRWIESNSSWNLGRATPGACGCERLLTLEKDARYQLVERDSLHEYLLCAGVFRLHPGSEALPSEVGPADFWASFEGWWSPHLGGSQLIRFIGSGKDTILTYPGGRGMGVADASWTIYERVERPGQLVPALERITRLPLSERPRRSEIERLPLETDSVYYERGPVAITRVEPEYPLFAAMAGIQGQVILHVLVAQDGKIMHVNVLRSLHGVDEAAVRAAWKWVFRPAMARGAPVAAWIQVPVPFPPAGAPLPPKRIALPFSSASARTERPRAVVKRVRAVYHDFAHEARLTGREVLRVLVAPDGSVDTVEVHSGTVGLDEVALNCVWQWVFEPLRDGGNQAPAWTEVTLLLPFDACPPEVLEGARSALVARVGQRFFTQCLTLDSVRCAVVPRQAGRDMEYSWLLPYRLSIPKKPWVEGTVRVKVDTTGALAPGQAIDGIGDCAHHPEECAFSVDEEVAREIARRAGLKPGLAPRQTRFRWGEWPRPGYAWFVYNTLRSDGAGGDVAVIDANSGEFLGIAPWSTHHEDNARPAAPDTSSQRPH